MQFRFDAALMVVLGLGLGTASTSWSDTGGWTVSKNYNDVRNFIHALAQQHPDTTKLFNLGLSDSGQNIEGLVLGNGPIHNLLVATHHGNEYGSTEVAKAFAKSLAEAPIKGQTMFVIPVLNIAGYNSRTRWEPQGGQQRDPNRDYPGPCGTDGPFHLKDTAALAKFVEQQNIVASSTLHTFQPAVVYPWGISTHDTATPYDDQFKQMVQAATIDSHYETGNNTQLIYPADGTFEDYAFWKLGIWSILFELGNTHTPSDAQVNELISLNVNGMRRMYEQAPTRRADKHDFTGKCSNRSLRFDYHRE